MPELSCTPFITGETGHIVGRWRTWVPLRQTRAHDLKVGENHMRTPPKKSSPEPKKNQDGSVLRFLRWFKKILRITIKPKKKNIKNRLSWKKHVHLKTQVRQPRISSQYYHMKIPSHPAMVTEQERFRPERIPGFLCQMDKVHPGIRFCAHVFLVPWPISMKIIEREIRLLNRGPRRTNFSVWSCPTRTLDLADVGFWLPVVH